MTVYIDMVLIINFIYDFLLLISVSLILNRKTTLKKLLISSLVGTLMVVGEFFDNGYLLLIFKFLMTILMLVLCFGYRDIRYTFKNLIYLYICSITLGGSLSLITIKLNYSSDKLVIYKNNYQISLIFLLLITPIILYLYVRNMKKLRDNYNKYYKLTIYLNNSKKIITTSFLDTGNGLYDPYHHRPILLVSKSILNIEDKKYIYVPCHTIGGVELLKCFKIDKILIEGIGYRYNLLVGVYNHKINIDGVDAILHRDLLNKNT